MLIHTYITNEIKPQKMLQIKSDYLFENFGEPNAFFLHFHTVNYGSNNSTLVAVTICLFSVGRQNI